MRKATIGELVRNDTVEDAIEGAIMAAYWYGQAVAARRIGLRYQAAIKAAREKAKGMRYHHQAERLLSVIDGGQGYIYDASFGELEIGEWDFELPEVARE